jgi:hypothetical protein
MCAPQRVSHMSGLTFFVGGSKGGFGVGARQLNDGVTCALAQLREQGLRVPDTIIKRKTDLNGN